MGNFGDEVADVLGSLFRKHGHKMGIECDLMCQECLEEEETIIAMHVPSNRRDKICLAKSTMHEMYPYNVCLNHTSLRS